MAGWRKELALFVNSSKPHRNTYAMACCVIIGMALQIGGMQYLLFCVLAMYLMLGAMGLRRGFELLLVASVCGGEALCQGLHILMLDPSLYRLSRIWEPVAVAVLAIALLITQKRVLSWCLIVYLAFRGVLLLWFELFHIPKASRSRLPVSEVIMCGMMMWLLVRWFLKNKTDRKGVSS